MRAIEPCRACIRSGCGRRSRILDWSVEGPRGAKPWEPLSVSVSGKAEARGEWLLSSSLSPALPWPSAAISDWRWVVVIIVMVSMAMVAEAVEWAHLGASGQGASRLV